MKSSTDIINKILTAERNKEIKAFLKWLDARHKKMLGCGCEMSIAEVCCYLYNKRADDRAVIVYKSK